MFLNRHAKHITFVCFVGSRGAITIEFVDQRGVFYSRGRKIAFFVSSDAADFSIAMIFMLNYCGEVEG